MAEEIEPAFDGPISRKARRRGAGALSALRGRSGTGGLPDPATPLPFHWDEPVPLRFSRIAADRESHPAVIDSQGTWTYGQLDRRSNQLARLLGAAGVGTNDLVAIYAVRSASLAWAMLGVWKAGAAFVVLDSGFPAPRLIETLRVARPCYWISVGASAIPGALEDAVSRSLGPSRLMIALEPEARGPWRGFSEEEVRPQIGPRDLAYVVFTSGTTRVPKGVASGHAPISHFLDWHCRQFGLEKKDRFSLLSGLSHDPLLRDVFTPFWVGATLCAPARADISSSRLATWMCRERITVSHLTPAFAELLTAAGAAEAAPTLPGLRYAFFGGDALRQADLARFRAAAPRATCVNFYGTTETPQAMSYHVVSGEARSDSPPEIVPIGRGIDGCQLLVLTESGAMARPAERGEIHVRSPYLSNGYLGDEAATASRFVVNPFTGDSEDRLYRTGDLGHYLPDGSVAFRGRADRQVKIRGFRIELEEIESLVSGQPGVRNAAAVVREDWPEEKRLVAYVVREEGTSTSARELRRFLRRRLPDSMVPADWVFLAGLPLTSNGKVDAEALPAPPRGRESWPSRSRVSS